MELAIIGLPQSGKTTAFNALTGGHAETSGFGRTGLEQNIGVVKVPDRRLDQLAALSRPKKVTPAEIRYLDIGGTAATFEGGRGLGGPVLNVLGASDALIHVVRAFSDPSVPHVRGSVDPARDIEAVNLELAFNDAAAIERRLERLANSMKAAKASEREAGQREQEWLLELKGKLENEVPLREIELTDEQRRSLSSYALLTAKPLLVLLNVGEDQLAEVGGVEQEYRRFQRPGTAVHAFCAKLEMELAQMEPEEAKEFREAMGVAEPGIDRVIHSSYALLGLISFFTTGPDETRAWTIRRGETAPQAAGKIHSDLERGFIRAEVVPYEKLLEAGSWANARSHGYLRSEGKTYVVQEGDVVNILFSK